MSKTKRKNPRRDFEVRPLARHVRNRQCDSCAQWFPEDEVVQDSDELGRVLGWLCGGCI